MSIKQINSWGYTLAITDYALFLRLGFSLFLADFDEMFNPSFFEVEGKFSPVNFFEDHNTGTVFERTEDGYSQVGLNLNLNPFTLEDIEDSYKKENPVEGSPDKFNNIQNTTVLKNKASSCKFIQENWIVLRFIKGKSTFRF